MIGHPRRSSDKWSPGGSTKYDCFHLVLMVTHACNLRCDYCYTGAKSPRSMSLELGQRSIERAVKSVHPGGTLELGFFGGEPLLEARLIAELIDYAQRRADAAEVMLRPGLTTNGTVRSMAAWDVMMRPELDLCVSCDGLPNVHDRHRRATDGRGSAERVLGTIRRLLEVDRDFPVIMVIRPDTVPHLPAGIEWLRGQGVLRIDLALDVWAVWESSDVERLEEALIAVADIWREGLPDGAINWFDEKAAHLAKLPMNRSARCGFGDGEIAVAPSGHLYPCERLIGEDQLGHPMRLPGHALDGSDFCRSSMPGRSDPACSPCAIASHCNTTCRCNNYVRTGDITRPDALLCLLERVCCRETARVLGELSPTDEQMVSTEESV